MPIICSNSLPPHPIHIPRAFPLPIPTNNMHHSSSNGANGNGMQRRHSWLFRSSSSSPSTTTTTTPPLTSATNGDSEGALASKGLTTFTTAMGSSSTASSTPDANQGGTRPRKLNFIRKASSTDSTSSSSSNVNASSQNNSPSSLSEKRSFSMKLGKKLLLHSFRGENQQQSDENLDLEGDVDLASPSSAMSAPSAAAASGKPKRRSSWVRSSSNRNANDVSNMLDRAWKEKSKSPSQKIKKVLIGGLESSGKSTLFKHMNLIARTTQDSSSASMDSAFSKEEKERALDLLASSYHELARFIAEYAHSASKGSGPGSPPKEGAMKKVMMKQDSSGMDFSGSLAPIVPIYEKSEHPPLELKNVTVIAHVMGLLLILLDIPLVTAVSTLREPLSECLKRLGMVGALSDVDLSSFPAGQTVTIGHILNLVFQNLNMHKVCLQAYRSGRTPHIPVPYLLKNYKRILKGITVETPATVLISDDDVIHAAGSLHCPARYGGESLESVHDYCDETIVQGNQVIDLCRNHKKWPAHFSQVKTFLYVVSLGNGTAHITESLVLFKQLLQSPYLEKTSFIVCMTKLDHLTHELQMDKADITEITNTIRAAFQECYTRITTQYESSHYSERQQLRFQLLSGIDRECVQSVMNLLN